MREVGLPVAFTGPGECLSSVQPCLDLLARSRQKPHPISTCRFEHVDVTQAAVEHLHAADCVPAQRGKCRVVVQVRWLQYSNVELPALGVSGRCGWERDPRRRPARAPMFAIAREKAPG